MKYVLILALAVSLTGLAIRLIGLLRYPNASVYSRGRGSSLAGAVYALTWSMAPGQKESTRLHPWIYLRGIVFHLGIFIALALLVITLFLNIEAFPPLIPPVLSALLSLAAISGVAGLVSRFEDHNLRRLSIPDDYFSLVLVTGLLALAALALLEPRYTGMLQAWGAVLLCYLPFGKLSHFLYWFSTRIFLGTRYGHRGLMPGPAGGREVPRP